MALALDAIKSARIYLNDINGITWSDSLLMPLLQEAYGEILQELDLNQLGVLKYESCPILVPAGHFDLGTDQPLNILDPISMLEKAPGESDDFYQEMILVDYLPKQDMNYNLLYWTWRREVIKFIGATSDRIVIIRYKGSLTPPQLLTDKLGIIFSEKYLGPRIASLVKDSLGQDSSKFTEIASRNLYSIIKRGVLEDQRPIRRRPYREAKGYSIPVGTVVGNISAIIPSGTYQRTVLLKDLTIGNNIADNVVIWGPVNYTGQYQAKVVEVVLRKAITQDLHVDLTMKGVVYTNIIVPHTLIPMVPMNFINFINAIFPNDGVFSANITASDGSVDIDGICSLTTLYIPYSTLNQPCG